MLVHLGSVDPAVQIASGHGYENARTSWSSDGTDLRFLVSIEVADAQPHQDETKPTSEPPFSRAAGGAVVGMPVESS